MGNENLNRTPSRLFLVSLILVLGIALVFVGVFYYRSQKDKIRAENYSEIATVAKLKAMSIQQWHAERLDDARQLAASPQMKRAILQWLRSGRDARLRKPVQEQLEFEQRQGLYVDVFIVGDGGQTLFAAGRDRPEIEASEKQVLGKVVIGGAPVMSDFFRGRTSKIYLDAMAPVFEPAKGTAIIAVLRIDAAGYLYPIVGLWPVSSPTSETLLIERAGDSVLFLNDLRFRSSTALSLRVPLSSVEVPAVQAVLGKVGIFEGKDYRGKDVVADLRPIPDTPWFVVAKVDATEFLGEAYYRGIVVSVMIVMFMILSIIMTAYVYHRRQAVIYKDLYRAEIERAEIKGWFRATLYSIGDGVITTDVSGRVKDMNPVAERLTGWRETDAKGKRLPEVFQTVDEITQMPVPCPADRVLQDGFAVELSNHTMLVSLDGRKCPIADSAAPIRDEDGKTTGVVVVFRDQSKEREADESLRQSEARLRRAELTSGSGNWEFRLDSQIVVVSEGAQKIYGVNNGWLTYDDIRTIPLPEYQPLLDKALDDLVHHDRPYDVEFKIRAVDTGETKDLHSVAVFDHETGALVGVIQDVSGQKRAEEEMRISRQMLRDVLDSVPVRVFWKDANSRYLGCNLAFARDFGFDSVEDIVGKVDFQLSTREFAERYRASDRKVLETGESQLAYEEPRLFPGGIRWVRTSKVPLKNALGEIDGVLGTYEDITERRQEREELRESEEKFRGLVEGSAAAIWIHDTKKFIYANPAAAEITGHTVEELYRLSPFDIVHPDFREMVMRRSEDRIGGKDTPKHYEYQILHKSGRPIWIDFSGSIIYKQGRPVIIASAYDITERKALEDRLIQSQKMEGIGRLAGGIAHDYNNMLGVIMGYTQLLAKKVVGGEPASHYLELISSAAKRGAEMTRQLLAFARREIVSPKPIDPNAAITSIKKMIENLIGEDIELRFLPGKPLWNIKIDPTQFDQILLNLATNARDAIKGVGTITIETTNVVIGEEYSRTRIGASPGEYVKLSFSDTGQGMPKDTLDKIFEPFFTTKPKGEGTGLGLSTVYGIVHQNGGEIDVYSEVGHGTTFKVYLPRYYGELENPEIQLDRTPVTGHATILIVEDQPRLVELFKEFLENFGYRVLTAVSPDEALSICEDYEGEIDLLLTDVVMPGMNGKELKDRVRILKPEVKTLFMSGYTADVIAQRGILDEGVEFLQKPFTPDELARKVADVLKS